MSSYRKIAQLKTVAAFRERLEALQIALPVDDEILTSAQGSPMAAPLKFGSWQCGNRWVVHPMEGWDAHRDGSPSAHTRRRWRRFGESGAKLIWGGEAAAVQADGRANPNQTLAIADNRDGLQALLQEARDGHQSVGLDPSDLIIGLQLTHSGRFCRPNSKQLEPRIAYHHPLLDAKFGIDPSDDSVVWTDQQLEDLIDRYVAAAQLAMEIGFQFVDIKACHGYLLHEFLSARSRPGRFGGDLDGRTRLLTTIIERVRESCPKLEIVVRMSVFDTLPYQQGETCGQPHEWTQNEYPFGFGVDLNDPLRMDLSEPIELIRRLKALDVVSVNVSCGSPYYNPHIQRPAIFPPSDGYQPPEDPLVGVARQIQATRECKQAVPEMVIVGTGYSYLQDYLPHVAQAVVREGWTDMVGLGRMVLSYPGMPLDTLREGKLQRKLICRTFSDCTTAPRNAMISGCFPLDTYYKSMPIANELKTLKQQ